MQYYNNIDVSDGIDFNKGSAWKECIFCHYRNFSRKDLDYSYLSLTTAMMY